MAWVLQRYVGGFCRAGAHYPHSVRATVGSQGECWRTFLDELPSLVRLGRLDVQYPVKALITKNNGINGRPINANQTQQMQLKQCL